MKFTIKINQKSIIENNFRIRKICTDEIPNVYLLTIKKNKWN